MKFQKLSAIVGEEISRKIFRDSFEMPEAQVTRTILNRPREERELLLSSYTQQLIVNIQTSQNRDVVRRSARLLKKLSGSTREIQSYLSDEVIATVFSTLQIKSSYDHAHQKQPSSSLTTEVNPVLSLGQFATYSLPLNELAKKTEELQREDFALAKHIANHIHKISPIPGNKRFIIVENHPFILSPLPKTTSEVEKYLNACLKKNVRVLVSAHEYTDKPERCSRFWHADQLAALQLENGWILEHQERHAPVQGSVPNKKGRIPEIVETTLHAHHPSGEARSITHLHFDGWVDTQAPSDTLLYETLLDRIQELNQEGQTLAINCVGGVGRTGNIATTYLLRLMIDQSRQRTNIDSICVNIPRLIAKFRLQRKIIGNNFEHLTSIYAITASYVSRLTQRYVPDVE